MNIADDLVRAFNDGYEKGKADAEFYLLHVGDTDEPQTNGDRVRYELTDAELVKMMSCPYSRCIDLDKECNACMLEWLKSPAEKDGET